MTCIVGVVHDGKTYVGGDSAGVAGLDLQVRKDPKVFRNGDFVIGFTSSFRMGQLLAHAFTPPKRHADADLYAYMVTDFVNAVRECLKSGGYAEKSSEAERGGTFLVGIEGRLFKIENDYQVGEAGDGYDACGCGAQVALGALHAMANQEPTKRLKTALEAAERFSAGVRAPFVTVSA